jgi:pimeloyl-ACP methyl ester carboxylesterase
MATATEDAQDAPMSFISINDDKTITVVLLHGGFTCHLEFERVFPLITEFHLLLPDLPCHSKSRHIKPATTDNSAKHVAHLIKNHAHGGKAHLVGVSMGGFIAQCLALEQPELCHSIFVTGSAPLAGRRLSMVQWTRTTYYFMRLVMNWTPEWYYRSQLTSMGITVSDEFLAETRNNITWDLVKDMFPWITKFTLDHVKQLQVRTLHIAGGFGDKGDDVPMMEKTAEALRNRHTSEGQPWPEDGSCAVVVRDATHGWDMQFPERFAQGVTAWVNEQPLPAEFERL